MDYSFNDLKNAASLIQKSVFGKKSEYELKFNHEADGCWYVDFPDWPFDHHNLMMVAGADDLCDFLSDDGLETRVKVIPSTRREKHDGYAELRRTDHVSCNTLRPWELPCLHLLKEKCLIKTH